MKLRELEIKNYRCIGAKGITLTIDNIVILIGANNSGKSTVIDAYKHFVGTNKEDKQLSAADFHATSEDSKKLIPIEMIGLFSDLSIEEAKKSNISEKWVFTPKDKRAEYGERCVKYRFTWERPNEPRQKHSWNGDKEVWEEKGMGGLDTLISSCAPAPVVVNPFDKPEELENKILEILISNVQTTIKTGGGKIEKLVQEIDSMINEIRQEISAELDDMTKYTQEKLQDVFQEHKVDINLDFDGTQLKLDKLLEARSHLTVISSSGSHPLSNQGTGLQRAFLWSAITALCEGGKYSSSKSKKNITPNDSKMLIIEEPEAFLHPPAIRAARESLYKLAELENWQVLITTHSPIFIDISKSHTTILRTAKDRDGATKTFSTDKADFDEEERQRLNMILACHPTVTEFFFADKVILVEGNTELALFSYALRELGKEYDYQIVNCIGKMNIVMFQKILRHFAIPYIVIHDIDTPKTKNGNRNPAWACNQNILEEANKSKGNIVIAHMPDLERQYFNEIISKDKPFEVLQRFEKRKLSQEMHRRLLDIFDEKGQTEHPFRITTDEDYTKRVKAGAHNNSRVHKNSLFDDN